MNPKKSVINGYTIAHNAPENISLLMGYSNLRPEKAEHTAGFHLEHTCNNEFEQVTDTIQKLQ